MGQDRKHYIYKSLIQQKISRLSKVEDAEGEEEGEDEERESRPYLYPARGAS